MIVGFKVACSKTINLGNYQSLRIEAEVQCEIDSDAGETLVDAKATAQQELKRLLEETYRSQYKNAEYDPSLT